MINKFYLLCVIFSGSPDLTLKTCLVHLIDAKNTNQSTGNDVAAGMTAVLNHIHYLQYIDYKLTLLESALKYTMCKTESMYNGSGFMSCSPSL